MGVVSSCGSIKPMEMNAFIIIGKKAVGKCSFLGEDYIKYLFLAGPNNY